MWSASCSTHIPSFYHSDIINLFLIDYTWCGLCNIRCSTISTHTFSVPPFLRKYLNPQFIRINKMVKQCKYHPCLSRLASRIQYYKVGNIFEFTVFIFLENALNLGVFYSWHPTPHPPYSPSLSLKFLSSHPRQREITHSLQAAFFRKSVSPNSRTGGGN